MSDDDRAAADARLLDRHAAQLAEHFDSVLIVVTRHEGGPGGGTTTIRRSAGNFHANLGAAREWVIRCDEMTRVHARDSQRGDD